MDRKDALAEVQKLIGKDLRPMADELAVPVWKSNGKKNKGWAGHVIERYLGLPINSAQAPNGGSWELKVVPLKMRNGVVQVKETMAITMIDPHEVALKEFEDSHLLNKMRKKLVVAWVFESVQDTRGLLYSVTEFDLDDPRIYALVKADYNTVRDAIRAYGDKHEDLERGFLQLTGKMGVLVQPRTKGAGHGSTSRAFYARTQFVAHILNIGKPLELPPVVANPADPLPEDE
jgi:DNA mismatch repair protein MutH